MNRMTDMTKNLSNFFSERGLVASQQLGPVEFLSQTIFLSYGLRKGKFRCAEPQAGVSGTDNPSAELN